MRHLRGKQIDRRDRTEEDLPQLQRIRVNLDGLPAAPHLAPLDVEAWFARLTSECSATGREVLRLLYLEKWSLTQIAKRFGVERIEVLRLRDVAFGQIAAIHTEDDCREGLLLLAGGQVPKHRFYSHEDPT